MNIKLGCPILFNTQFSDIYALYKDILLFILNKIYIYKKYDSFLLIFNIENIR